MVTSMATITAPMAMADETARPDPHVGADLDVMKADTARRPWLMTDLKTLAGVDVVVRFIEQRGMLAPASAIAGSRVRAAPAATIGPAPETWESGLIQRS